MLHLLEEDVLYHILALLDVHTVLTLSSVNKALHVIASSRQTWLRIAWSLSARGLFDIPNTVQHLLRGTRFDFHRHGSAAVVSLACYKVVDRSYLSNYILVLPINLESRDPPIEFFRLEMDWNVPCCHQISGNFLACSLERGATRSGSILLLNWWTEEFIIFDCLPFPTGGFANYRISLSPAFALVPGYLFLARDCSPTGTGTRLEIYPISSLDAFWQPLNQLTRETPSECWAFVHSITVAPNHGYNYYSHHVSVSVAECVEQIAGWKGGRK
ncbi:hypothetical protein FB45DRAFT_1066332 [Roridomyces roridus]|uniref:F-box domain-containing protein n=1 Tax=Roridomyces roridus TaxID=1738132 RepID=A0AAD7F994_9AGAR|nr:hypothetical protein FB45DRAFT_1066332 [Roridomyces roridus]